MAVPRLREGGLRRGEKFWFRLTTASAQCLRLSERFFIFFLFLCVALVGISCVSVCMCVCLCCLCLYVYIFMFSMILSYMGQVVRYKYMMIYNINFKKLISFKFTVKATVTALKRQILFCQDSRQNIGERPYVYKRNRIQIRVHGCWLKRLISLNLNTISPLPELPEHI